MAIKERKAMPRRCASAAAWIASMVLGFSLPSLAQQPVRGTITGAVSSDRGRVIGFRVAAHNLDRRLWYTVFTSKGRYTVPQALPGRYEVMVNEPGYDSPTVSVQLAPGESKTADLGLKNIGEQAWTAENGDGNLDHRNRAARTGGLDSDGKFRLAPAKVEYVSTLEELYPPAPALGLLREDCIGCHGNGFGSKHYTKEQFIEGIERATETGPGFNENDIALGRTPINKSQKEMLADYLVKAFGPEAPDRELRVDPLVPDESVVSKQIYVSYDVPDDLPFAPGAEQLGADMVDGVFPQEPTPYAVHHLQEVFISPVDGNVWISCGSCNSLLRLNPTAYDSSERWKNYPIKGANHVQPSGITIDNQGRVYWAELRGGMLGELDPATGTQIRHPLPQQVGAIHEAVLDKDGNVGFGLIWGAEFGRMEAKTHKIHMYPTPTPHNGIYGLVFDQHGNLWGGGWQKGTIDKWDVDTEAVKEYRVPNAWGMIRRPTVDSKGIVWAGEYNSGILARLDPATEKLTEYKVPLNGANPYETWADRSDNIWIADQPHSAMIKFEPNTGKFTFYLMPQPHQSVPKIEVADDNTIWFGTRGKKIAAAVHFYPDGYTAKATPIP
jgi:virginiamycin B lyase